MHGYRDYREKGLAPVEAELEQIQAMRSRADLAAEVAHLHREGVGALFRLVSAPDPRDSSRMVASLAQGGLSLPDRDYYLKTDATSVETRQRFAKHTRTMFELAGDSVGTAKTKAEAVLDLETRLMKASLDRVSRRDPGKTHHLILRTELDRLAPEFGWDEYFYDIGAPAFEKLDIEWPDFFKAMPFDEPLDSWKAYFAYHVLDSAAAQLPAAFEKEDFDFRSRYIGGVTEQRPRANRCVNFVDAQLGDLLGQQYVEAAFGADAKARITQLAVAGDGAREGYSNAGLEDAGNQGSGD